MATPETLPSPAPQQLSEVYPALDFCADPLEIASRAITKLREHGLQGYIQPVEINLLVESQTEIATHPVLPKADRLTATPAPVTNLEEYRTTRRAKLNAAKQLKLVQKAQQGDEAALEEVWVDAQNVATHVAGYIKTRWPMEDKIQTCLEVVPGVVKRFDSSAGASFKTYLIRRMFGALQDAEREYGHSNGVSRHDYTKLQEALESEDPQTALHELTRPSITKMGKLRPGFIMAPHLVHDGDVVTSQASLDEFMHRTPDYSDGINTAHEPAGSVDVFEEVAAKLGRDEINDNLSGAMSQLREKEKIVLTHYYGLFGLSPITLRKIGDILGVTESRVSQIHRGVVEKMALLLQGESVYDDNQNRLERFQEKPKTVGKDEFLQNINDALVVLKNSKLSDPEVEVVLANLESWEHKAIQIGNVEYRLLKRTIPANIEIAEDGFDNDESARRKLKVDDKSASVLVKDISATDLRLVIEIEKKIKKQGITYNAVFASQFTRREQEVIENLFDTYGQIGLKLGIENSTARTHIHTSMKRIGLSRVEDFAVRAAREGLVDLGDVPSGMTEILNPRQKRILKEFYCKTNKEAAEALGIEPHTVTQHWAKIYKKTGSSSRVQAIFMAMNDGLIPRFSLDKDTMYD